MKIVKHTFFVIFLVLLFSACNKDKGTNDSKSILIGTWVESQETSTAKEKFMWVFREDGTCTEYNIASGKPRDRFHYNYELDAKDLILSLSDDNGTFKVKIDFRGDDTLIFYGDDFFEDGWDYSNINFILYRSNPSNWF